MRVWPKRPIRPGKIYKEWVDLQKYCATRKTWPKAVIEADNLLDSVLKKRGYKGKTTGERLVSAQHDLSYNEEIWFSHKLAAKLKEPTLDVRKLKKQDIAMALAAVREALRELNALPKKYETKK